MNMVNGFRILEFAPGLSFPAAAVLEDSKYKGESKRFMFRRVKGNWVSCLCVIETLATPIADN